MSAAAARRDVTVGSGCMAKMAAAHRSAPGGGLSAWDLSLTVTIEGNYKCG